MNTDLIINIITEIARPLIILILALFLIPLMLKWFRKGKSITSQTADGFSSELEKVIQRANHILDDPVFLKKGFSENSLRAKEDIIKSWDRVDSELKKLAFDHCQVEPDTQPYPFDYTLFELEMKKKIGNTTIGFYRDLARLKDMVMAIPEQDLPPLSAAKYDLLAEHVLKMMKQGPLPGIGGIF